MARDPARFGDERLERLLARLLQAGVLLAALVVAAGGALYLWRHGAAPPGHHVFHGEPADLRRVGGILAAAAAGRAPAVIQVGLLLLIATPVARVLFSLVGFALQRDRVYVAATLIVLVILLYGLVGRPL